MLLGLDNSQTQQTHGRVMTLEPGIYPVEFCYTPRTLADLITAGRYNDEWAGINRYSFPLKGEGHVRVNLGLVRCGIGVTIRDALTAINEQGYCPAEIEYLLALGVNYKKLEHQFPILALGSFGLDESGCRYFPYLCGEVRDRALSIVPVDGDTLWGDHCRFLIRPQE